MGKHRTSNIQHPTPNEETNETNETNETWTLQDGDTTNPKYNLENRLLEFASAVIDLTEKLPSSRAGNHVAAQILRSGTSPYPNHGEAESAESRDDFIHKLKICLKELRETRRWARLILRKAWVKDDLTLKFILAESEELCRIFFSSIQTARKNNLKPHSTNAAQYPAGKAG